MPTGRGAVIAPAARFGTLVGVPLASIARSSSTSPLRQRPGLVAAQHVQAAQVLNGSQAFDDHENDDERIRKQVRELNQPGQPPDGNGLIRAVLDETSGGFLFGCYAYCPDCQDKGLKTIARDKEEWRIRGYCPQGKSFADWVRGRRGPDAVIRVERAKE